MPRIQLKVTEERVVIEGDLACAGCRYNLRGLAINGQCPECGQSVQRAMTQVFLSDRRDRTPLFLIGMVVGMMFLQGAMIHLVSSGWGGGWLAMIFGLIFFGVQVKIFGKALEHLFQRRSWVAGFVVIAAGLCLVVTPFGCFGSLAIARR